MVANDDSHWFNRETTDDQSSKMGKPYESKKNTPDKLIRKRYSLALISCN